MTRFTGGSVLTFNPGIESKTAQQVAHYHRATETVNLTACHNIYIFTEVYKYSVSQFSCHNISSAYFEA